MGLVLFAMAQALAAQLHIMLELCSSVILPFSHLLVLLVLGIDPARGNGGGTRME